MELRIDNLESAVNELHKGFYASEHKDNYVLEEEFNEIFNSLTETVAELKDMFTK